MASWLLLLLLLSGWHEEYNLLEPGCLTSRAIKAKEVDEACHLLGFMGKHGLDTLVDRERVHRLVTLAADRGNRDARLDPGIHLLTSCDSPVHGGTSQTDHTRALRYLKKASDQNGSTAKAYLGRMALLVDHGMGIDIAEAEQLLKLAEEDGTSPCFFFSTGLVSVVWYR